MTSRSKNKGNSFEREVAKFLTETYNAPFFRVIGSGAFVGGKNTARRSQMTQYQIQAHRGDINPPDTWLHFNAEAKNYEDLAFHQIYTGSCTRLDSWIEQLLTVREAGDLDILFIKITRKCRLVCVRDLGWTLASRMIYNSAQHGQWIIADFDYFFEHNGARVELFAENGVSIVQANTGLAHTAGDCMVEHHGDPAEIPAAIDKK